MKKKLLSATDWMQIHEIQDVATPKKTVEINITGIIGGSFCDDSAPDSINTKDKMRAELKALADVKADLIIVNIDSPGGSVAHGLSMHDLLASNPAEKETRIIGMTASIATVISQVGQTRKMSDNALFLVHHASMGIMGRFNAQELAVVINDLNAVDQRIQAVYQKRSGKTMDEITTLTDANNGQGKWMDSKETKNAGFIDEIFEPTKAAASIDPAILAKFKYPNIPIDMTKLATDTRTLLDKIKDGIIAIFTNSGAEKKDVPQEIQDQLAELETKQAELEAENTRLEAEATSAKGNQEITDQVNTLTGTVAERDLTITAHEATIAAHLATIAAHESTINQLKAKSTKVAGAQGNEGTDVMALTDDDKAWADSLANLRKEQTALKGEAEDDPKTIIK